jgi:hypothetical protein
MWVRSRGPAASGARVKWPNMNSLLNDLHANWRQNMQFGPNVELQPQRLTERCSITATAAGRSTRYCCSRTMSSPPTEQRHVAALVMPILCHRVRICRGPFFARRRVVQKLSITKPIGYPRAGANLFKERPTVLGPDVPQPRLAYHACSKRGVGPAVRPHWEP